MSTATARNLSRKWKRNRWKNIAKISSEEESHLAFARICLLASCLWNEIQSQGEPQYFFFFKNSGEKGDSWAVQVLSPCVPLTSHLQNWGNQELLLTAQGKDAKSVKIEKNKGNLKWKFQGSRCLPLASTDKAEKQRQSLPLGVLGRAWNEPGTLVELY